MALKRRTKIFLLSTWGDLLLPFYIHAFRRAGIPLSGVICAGRVREKTLAIMRDRYRGFLPEADPLDAVPEDLAFYFVKGHNAPECARLLRQLRPDLLVNGGTPSILKDHIIRVPRFGVVNSHPGLMPDFRGCTCVEWAILRDQPVGATCHLMSAAIDEGPILYKERMKVRRGWTYQRIRWEMAHHALKVMVRGVRAVIRLGASSRRRSFMTGGAYYSVIPPAEMKKVLKKISDGTYRLLE